MQPIVGGDMGVRCKPESVSQSTQLLQLGLDRALFALESRVRRGKGIAQNCFILFGTGQGREQVLDDGTTEAGLEQFLDLQHVGLMVSGVDPVAGSGALGIE